MKKSKMLTVRVELDLHDALTEWAKRENRSLNNLVETILLRVVQEKGKCHDSDA